MRLSRLCGLALLIGLLCGCDAVMEGTKTGWNEASLEGTWNLSSVEGGSPEQVARFLAAARGTSLALASDNTFKFTVVNDVTRGTWHWENQQVVLTETEINGKEKAPEVVTLSVLGDELIFRDDGRSYVLSRR